MFAYIGQGGEVKNLAIENGDVRGNNYVGSFVGMNEGRMFNCYSTTTVTAMNEFSGGIVGAVDGGLIRNCYATGTVTGRENIGGIVGIIKESYATSTVVEYCRGSILANASDFSVNE